MKKSLTTLSVSCALLIGGASVAMAGHHITPQEKKLIAGAKSEGSVTLINPLISDRTSKRLQKAFREYYGLGDGFKYNNLRKGTGATVSQVRRRLKRGNLPLTPFWLAHPVSFLLLQKEAPF